MTERPAHRSDSRVQRDAETVILELACQALGVPELRPGRYVLADGVQVQVDGVSPDRTVYAEAYARQGPLRGAQLKKISRDVLKLSLIRRTDPRPDLRTVIVLASQEADQSIRGWLRHGADVLGVDFLVIELDQDWRSRITAAQTTQLMVNLPAELVDDLLEDPVQEP